MSKANFLNKLTENEWMLSLLPDEILRKLINKTVLSFQHVERYRLLKLILASLKFKLILKIEKTLLRKQELFSKQGYTLVFFYQSFLRSEESYMTSS